jgi:hypothetical protein
VQTAEEVRTVPHTCFITKGCGGLIDERWCTEHYAETLAQLPPGLPEKDLERPELLLHRDKKIDVYFAPLDYVNSSAKVLLVGLSPTRAHLHLAVTVVADRLRAGASPDESLAAVNTMETFATSTRANLIRMADGIGLHSALGLRSCAALFDERTDLISATYAISHAVFVRSPGRLGRNYAGAPPLEGHPLLSAIATQVLAANAAMTPGALVVPLGNVATIATRMAGLAPDRVVDGFPHPSGANGHRLTDFKDRQGAMRATVSRWFGKEAGPHFAC